MGRAPPLFPYCRVLVNHRYRTLYLKAPKTGSTSLLTLLGSCNGGANDKPTCFEPLVVRAPPFCSLAPAAHAAPPPACMPCAPIESSQSHTRGLTPDVAAAPRLPQPTSPAEYERTYSDYFVFAVVRNPWARAVSSYRMLARYTQRTCAALFGNWSSVCLDLNHLGRLHHDHPECTRNM